MSVKIGSSAIDKILVGSDEIGKIYVGQEPVYQAGGLPPGYIDTGLGWACKSEYYLDEVILLSTWSGGYLYDKNFAGPCIACAVYNPNTYSGPLLLSTNATNVIYRSQPFEYDEVIDGQHWYLQTKTWVTNQRIVDNTANLPIIETQAGEYETHAILLRTILGKAGVILL